MDFSRPVQKNTRAPKLNFMSHYDDQWVEEYYQKRPELAGKAGMQTRTLKPTVDICSAKPLPVTPNRDYKAELLQQLDLVGIKVEPEFKFLVDRKFRADWRIPGTKILVEFDGGLFSKGKAGHSSVAGILRDMEKINLAAINGWTVIRVAPNHVVSGQGLNWIEAAIKHGSRGIV